MNNNKSILAIGYGNMGSAIVERIQSLGFIPHLVLSKGSEKIQLAEKNNIKYTLGKVPQAKFDYLLLGVKPQQLTDIEAYAKQFLAVEENGKAVIISVLAGISISRLQKIFPKNAIVRTMPNLGLTVGKSFTLAKHDGLNEEQLNEISNFLLALGTYEFTNNEEWLNTIIPISGSGLGYAAYFILQIIKSGISLGLPEQLTKKAILQTVEAAVSLCKQEGQDISLLVQQVCSKGGTTEAGIKTLEDNEFANIILKCVNTTCEKAKELSRASESEQQKITN